MGTLQGWQETVLVAFAGAKDNTLIRGVVSWFDYSGNRNLECRLRKHFVARQSRSPSAATHAC